MVAKLYTDFGTTYNDQVLCPSEYGFKVGFYVLVFVRSVQNTLTTNFYHNDFTFKLEKLSLTYNINEVPPVTLPCTNIDSDHSCLDDGIIKSVPLPKGAAKTFWFTYSNPSNIISFIELS